jgi:integrase
MHAPLNKNQGSAMEPCFGKKQLQPRVLTDRFIHSLRAAPAGKRYAVSDVVVPSLKVRITDKGGKTFILWRRLRRGAKSATALALGRVGELSLQQARVKAREWIAMIAAGRDPREHERATRDATFAVVLEDYLHRHVRGKRKAKDVEREMRRELLSRWEHKPVTTISRRDIIAMVNEIKDRAPYQAHNVLSHCKTFFGWAVEQSLLEHSPADHISCARLIGARRPRQRILTDDELRRFWAATGAMGYPYGCAFRMLLLTGQRRNEVVGARWSEFNLEQKLWTIPAERFKSDATHLVPLSDAVMQLLAELPRWANGDCLFSFNGGRMPPQNFSGGKKQLDELMGKAGFSETHFVTHDIRRSVRTRLAALRVPDGIAEQVIGHGRRGIERVYNLHSHIDEMRAALQLWASKLHEIVAEKI